MTCERCGDVSDDDNSVGSLFDISMSTVFHHNCMLCGDCYREWVKVSVEKVTLFVESLTKGSVSADAENVEQAAIHSLVAVRHEAELVKLYGDWLKGTRVE